MVSTKEPLFPFPMSQWKDSFPAHHVRKQFHRKGAVRAYIALQKKLITNKKLILPSKLRKRKYLKGLRKNEEPQSRKKKASQANTEASSNKIRFQNP